MTIEEMYKQQRIEDVYILARYLYRIGKPVLSDSFYDRIEIYLKQCKLLPEYTSRSYDDDPIPLKLLKEIGQLNLIPKKDEETPYDRYLDEEKSLSIQPITYFDEAFTYFRRYADQDLIISLKVDGVNCKTLYIDGELKVSLSRGRKGVKGFNYTKGICRVFPINICTNEKELKVYSEGFVSSDYLEELRRKYKDPEGFVTEKSSAISLLRGKYDEEDYKHFNSLVFYAEDLPNVETKSEVLEELTRLGFRTVPYKVIAKGSVPKDYDKFCDWLTALCTEFSDNTLDIPSDGLVVDINDLKYESTVTNQYADRNIALKLCQWSFDLYYGKVKEIIMEQKQVKASVRARIEPLRTKDRATARVVNLHNPRIMIDNNIKIGSIIPFERNSDAINTFVYGDKLKEYERKQSVQGGSLNDRQG